MFEKKSKISKKVENDAICPIKVISEKCNQLQNRHARCFLFWKNVKFQFRSDKC